MVRRRFSAGLRNLFAYYLGIVDSWQVIDRTKFDDPRMIAEQSVEQEMLIHESTAWQSLKEWQQ